MGYAILEDCSGRGAPNGGIRVVSPKAVFFNGNLPTALQINPMLVNCFSAGNTGADALREGIAKVSEKEQDFWLRELRLGGGCFFTIRLDQLDIPDRAMEYIAKTLPSFTGKCLIAVMRDYWARLTQGVDIPAGVVEQEPKSANDILCHCLGEGLGEVMLFNERGFVNFLERLGGEFGFGEDASKLDSALLRFLVRRYLPCHAQGRSLVAIKPGPDILQIAEWEAITGHIAFEPENAAMDIVLRVKLTLPDGRFSLIDTELAAVEQNRVVAVICECAREGPFAIYFHDGKFCSNMLPTPINERWLGKLANPKTKLILSRLGWLKRA